jgi:AAA domain, putative AbiEii toxin, Type IV TA system
MITRIEAINYRCFQHLDLRLGAYQIFAGVNGSGKTTLLDIPVLLGDILKYGFFDAFLEVPAHYGSPRAQALHELFHCQQGSSFGFALEIELPQEIVEKLANPDRYQLASEMLDSPNQRMNAMRYEIGFKLSSDQSLQVEEFLYLMPKHQSDPGRDRPSGIGHPPLPEWQTVIDRKHDCNSVLLAEIPDEVGHQQRITMQLSPEALTLSNVFSDMKIFLATTWLKEFLVRKAIHYMPNGLALRRPCPPSRAMYKLRPDGANLPWLVLNLHQTNPDLFLRWVDHVKTALPNISQIDAVERAEDRHAYLKISYYGGYEVTSSGLSDGTLHILALTILPYLSNNPGLICIEEPENGIHPRAIETTLQSLSSIYDSQVWVTTQSPVVLAHSQDLSSIVVMQAQNDGNVHAMKGNEHPRLRDWQGSIDLGSLFAAGVLG